MSGRNIKLAITTIAVFVPLSSGWADPLPPDTTYRPLPVQPFSAVKDQDQKQKHAVMQQQKALLEQRYDLRDQPAANVMMSGGRKAVQEGVRVRLPEGMTWEKLGQMPTEQFMRFAASS